MCADYIRQNVKLNVARAGVVCASECFLSQAGELRKVGLVTPITTSVFLRMVSYF